MKKLLALLLCLCLLTGCQLASGEEKKSERNDKLVGVFVTFDYLGGEIDLEQWLQDHPEALKNGGEITLDAAESMEYTARVPVLMGDNEWIVPNGEGLSMSQYWNGEYWTGFSTEGLCEVKSHLNGSEGADAIREEATIFVPLDAAVMYHTNPVYQTADGAFYTIPAMGLQGDVSSGGMSQSVSEETTWKQDGEECTFSAEYVIVVKGVALPERVAVVQMSADHKELARTEYTPGQMPETFTPEADAAYLIVEQAAKDSVTRQLCQPGDQSFTAYFQSEQIWCLPEYVKILWHE